jgi:phosphopentomutase
MRGHVLLLIYGKKLKRNIDLEIKSILSNISQTVLSIFAIPKIVLKI